MLLNTKKPVQAKLVGDTLVAVFRNSNPSLVWKFDLERNHSFTVALQGEEGDLELGVTSSKGEFYPIARFTSQEDAEEAFTAVQKILMKGKRLQLKALISWVIGIIFIIVAVVLAGKYISSSVSGIRLPASLSAASSPVKAQTGVPLPADQVLRPPQ